MEQYHFAHSYRGVEVEALCCADSKAALAEIFGARKSEIKNLAFSSGEKIEECRQNPGVAYIRKWPDTRCAFEIPEGPVLLSDFIEMADRYARELYS